MKTMTMQTDPICGGSHLIFGLFMGGSDLNAEYDLKTKSPYKITTQLCTKNILACLKELSWMQGLIRSS